MNKAINGRSSQSRAPVYTNSFPYIVFVPILVFALTITLFCTAASEVSPLATDPVNEYYSEALRSAKAWHKDAQLISVDWTLYFWGTPLSSIAYTFVSPSTKDFYLVYATKARITREEGDWSEKRPLPDHIDIDTLVLDSQEALDRIVELGAAGYAKRNSTYGDTVFLRVTRYAYEGPIIWLGSFSNTTTGSQLDIVIDDFTGNLMMVFAYGEREQSYWFRDLTQRDRLNVGDSAEFFDYLTLVVDNIDHSLDEPSTDITIKSSKLQGLRRGIRTYSNKKVSSRFRYEGYVIEIMKIGESWIDVEVMPVKREFVSPPVD